MLFRLSGTSLPRVAHCHRTYRPLNEFVVFCIFVRMVSWRWFHQRGFDRTFIVAGLCHVSIELSKSLYRLCEQSLRCSVAVWLAIQAKLASLTFNGFSLNECWRRPWPPLGKKTEHRVLLNSRPCCRKCRHIHRVKWRHISVVAIRSPFCRSTPSYCA